MWQQIHSIYHGVTLEANYNVYHCIECIQLLPSLSFHTSMLCFYYYFWGCPFDICCVLWESFKPRVTEATPRLTQLNNLEASLFNMGMFLNWYWTILPMLKFLFCKCNTTVMFIKYSVYYTQYLNIFPHKSVYVKGWLRALIKKYYLPKDPNCSVKLSQPKGPSLIVRVMDHNHCNPSQTHTCSSVCQRSYEHWFFTKNNVVSHILENHYYKWWMVSYYWALKFAHSSFTYLYTNNVFQWEVINPGWFNIFHWCVMSSLCVAMLLLKHWYFESKSSFWITYIVYTVLLYFIMLQWYQIGVETTNPHVVW